MNGKSLVTGGVIEDADTQPNIKIPEHEALALDLANLADTYEDDEPTLKMPAPIPQETRYPGIGLLIALVVGVTFWGTLGWIVFR